MEQWKEIPSTRGQYMVSDQGRIKSVGSKTRREKIMRISKQGTLPLVCYDEDGNKMSCMFSAHRLVAEAFIPNPDDHAFVSFLDGDKTNRASSNLAWHSSARNWNKARAQSLSDAQVEAARRMMDGRNDEGFCIAEVMAYLKLPFNESNIHKLFAEGSALRDDALDLMKRTEMVHGQSSIYAVNFQEDISMFIDHYNNSLS